MHNRPNLHNSILYKLNRNKLNTISISAEKVYRKELFQKHKDNLQKTWQILKQIINKQQMNRRNDTFFKIKDKLSTTAIESCEHFNDFFINVGPTPSKNIPLLDSGASAFIESLIRKSCCSNRLVSQMRAPLEACREPTGKL